MNLWTFLNLKNLLADENQLFPCLRLESPRICCLEVSGVIFVISLTLFCMGVVFLPVGNINIPLCFQFPIQTLKQQMSVEGLFLFLRKNQEL